MGLLSSKPIDQTSSTPVKHLYNRKIFNEILEVKQPAAGEES